MSTVVTATTALREEHRVILKALDVLDATAERLAAHDAVPEAAWAALVEWLVSFADVRHHAKEERWLFPALEAAGLPCAGGPVGVMLEEHDLGRALVHGMREGAAAGRAARAREYARLLRAHIDKEDHVLFELADALLAAPAVDALVRAYAAADAAQGAATEPVLAQAALARLAAVLECLTRGGRASHGGDARVETH